MVSHLVQESRDKLAAFIAVHWRWHVDRSILEWRIARNEYIGHQRNTDGYQVPLHFMRICSPVRQRHCFETYSSQTARSDKFGIINANRVFRTGSSGEQVVQ